ncbi:FtsQ-type POTRA domain-containing protein [Herbiconiux sp. P15]|uniref:FtsQ-type POTRA domain-containing protein n=1 Tax=Herbiconiux liukaitaii TaxID=3342799 RepID=UPI0035BA8818
MKRPPSITPPPAPPAAPPPPPPTPEKRAPKKVRPAAKAAAQKAPASKASAAKPAARAPRGADEQLTEPIERLPTKRPQRAQRAQRAERAERPERSERPGRLDADATEPVTRLTEGDLPRREPQRPARDEKPGKRSTDAKRELRRATRTRRRYERAEAKRFTQRSRRRRLAWMVAGASVAGLVIVVLLAAYSPLLAVRSIAVEGAQRLDAAAVSTALDDQLGRPLALVDYGSIERELAAFPYIESYSVEARPPDTLAVRVVERRPVAQVQTATGFDLIDAAGVTVQQWPDRIAGFPLMDLTGTQIGSPGFEAAAAVLMSLPDDLLASIDRISGTTPDSVTFVFAGVGQSVVWGSEEESELKARLLTRLIATQDPSLPVQYDVSSPQSPVVR